PLPVVDATQPAYIAFTSGSTGEPKGIVVPHRSIATSMREHGPATRVDTETRALQFASYTFDMSFQEMFTTLTHGGCVCVPSEAERWNDLAGAMERLGVNWAKLTPTVVRLLHPEQVPSLRTLVVGGEPITQDIIQTWAHRVDLIVSYGPAEASIMAAVSDPLAPTALPRVIGRQVGGTLHVVDAGNHDRLVEGSGEGELLIEGPILATGYLKDQSRTDATFIIDPKW
ncbi:Nonribosomal peptide synthetase 8, partial [Aspergillus fumigatus]